MSELLTDKHERQAELRLQHSGGLRHYDPMPPSRTRCMPQYSAAQKMPKAPGGQSMDRTRSALILQPLLVMASQQSEQSRHETCIYGSNQKQLVSTRHPHVDDIVQC